MASLNLYNAYSFLTTEDWQWFVTQATSSSVVLSSADGRHIQTFSGLFTYDSGGNVHGTATSTSYYYNSAFLYNVTGMTSDAFVIEGHALAFGDTQATNAYVLIGDDVINGSSGNDTLLGYAGNDIFNGSAGSDTLDGASGVTDTAIYAGSRLNFPLSKTTTAGFTLTKGPEGTDTLLNVERLKFSDSAIALDTAATQSGGETALLIGAVLPGLLALDVSKQDLLGAVLALFDAGYSMKDLSGAVLRLPVWDILTGHDHASNTDIADYLLTNVDGQAPDLGTLTLAVNALNTETFQGAWLANLVTSSAAQTHIDLVGLAQTGLVYI